MWPDFGETDLAAAISDFAHRERRFGTVGASGPVTEARG
jgi:undecaprenyl diphosphate synthase